jgi:prefoldin subunit 5
MDNISTKTADNCDCTTQCDEAKSLSNLVAQYNILNDKIVQLTATVAQIDVIKTMVDNNKKSIDGLNSSIKQFSDLMTKK